MNVELIVKDDKFYTKALVVKNYVDSIIGELKQKFNKFEDHINRITIRVIDTYSKKNVAGFYDPSNSSVTIVAKEVEGKDSVAHVLLHEIGHHISHIRNGLTKGYDSHRKTKEYYAEEIRAESYALEIITKYLNSSLYEFIINYLKRSISFMKNKFKKAISAFVSTVNRYGNYITGSTSCGGSWSARITTTSSTSNTTSYIRISAYTSIGGNYKIYTS